MVAFCVLPTASHAQVEEQDTSAIDVTSAAIEETAQVDTLNPLVDSVLEKKLDKVERKAKNARARRDWTTWRPDPKRALWLALVIPGGGQIYNRKYWKLPIVYGGFLGCAYAMRWNNQMYLDYSQAYLDLMDDDPTTDSYNEFLHLGNTITSANEERYKNLFQSRKNRYRRWRDLSFFVMLGVYALSVIDAYVDASLSQFDISDDLSLQVQPAVINSGINSAGSGSSTATNSLKQQALGVHGALVF